MGIHELSYREHAFDMARKGNEFIQLVTALAAGGGDGFEAAAAAKFRHSSPRVQSILQHPSVTKSAVSPLSTSSASAFSDFKLLAAGFAESLRSVGIFDRLLPVMRGIPVNSATVGSVDVGATAVIVTEGHVKTVSTLAVATSTLVPHKAVGAVVISKEFAKMGGALATQVIGDDLRAACAAAVDGDFITTLMSGISSTTSSGSTAEGVLFDLKILLDSVPSGNNAAFYLLTTPTIAKNLTVLATTTNSGQRAFEQMGPNGGSVANIPVLVSSAVPAGTIILVDASQVAAGASAIELDILEHATMAMDSAPDSPQTASTNYLGLWQSNHIAPKAERWVVSKKLRTSAAAAIVNIGNYGTGFSPA